MDKKPLFIYVRHPHRSDKFVACIAAVIHPDDHKIHLGFSQCRDGESFNAKHGRTVAIGRALKGSKVKPCPFKFFNPDGSYVWKDIVGAEIDLARFRAMNYFRPELCEADDKLWSESQLVLTVSSKHA